MKKIIVLLIVSCPVFSNYSCQNNSSAVIGGAVLSDLIKPIDGQSKRATSTQTDENGKPLADNADNSRVLAGDTKVVLDAIGPGVITHMWFTFLGPGPHEWAVNGSATHQEMLLRIFYDGSDKPRCGSSFW